ncbi:MAG: arginine--tRNA ligase [Alphaproteobacteria bacterium]|nr:MAG: arginine--tRNA ligase [Alphaproteobacteria bacterium]
MTTITGFLTELAGAAFKAEGLPEELGLVQVSDRPDLAQFQCNGALAAAKIAKAAPRQIAEKIAERLREDARLAEVTLAGPGFININVSDAYLEELVARVASDARFGVAPAAQAQTYILDFGGPNVAKPMHVGHLRSSIIGDSLQRLIGFVGHKTVSDVHLGDWGLQMGQLITEIKRRQPDLPYFDEAFEGDYPSEPPVSLEELEEIYPAASAACKADPARADEARQATAELQTGRPGYLALWKHFIGVSLPAVQREIGSLGVSFDLWKGESDVNDLIPDMVARMKADHVAEESDGAWVIRVKRNDDKSEMPPLILLKSDGSYTYGTTDLATIVDRVGSYDPDVILYLTDQRQGIHFEQVFRSAHKANIAGKASFEHIGFGTINGTDGKPFKTREGGVMKLHDLIAMAHEKALERLKEAGIGTDFSEAELSKVASQVAIAAIKFADLSNFRRSDYIFDLDRFMTFEGKTGPYLQYAAVRIKSILRRAGEAGEAAAAAPILIRSEAERNLVLELEGLTAAVQAAFERRAPNALADYVYGLAQSYSRFYTEHHILSEEDAALKASRLRLCLVTLGVITLGLGLLGIEVPDRM